MMNEAKVLTCDGEQGCNQPVTHIDYKGWAYCAKHGEWFKDSRPVRQMRGWEIARLKAGKTIAYERYTKQQFLARYEKAVSHA